MNHLRAARKSDEVKIMQYELMERSRATRGEGVSQNHPLVILYRRSTHTKKCFVIQYTIQYKSKTIKAFVKLQTLLFCLDCVNRGA